MSQETPNPQTEAPEPLGDATCSALISVLQEVGARLKDGFDTRGVPCKVKPFLYGFEIQVSGVSLCIGGRGTVEKPDLCVSSCECDLDGNITGPLINPLELEIPVTSEQPSLDGLGSQRTMVGETLASGDGEQATDDTQIGVDNIDEVLSNHKEFSAERPSAPTVSQEAPSPQTTAPEPLGGATCSASSDFISQTSENGNSNPDKNPSGASQLSQYSLAQGSRTSLLRFVECPELWRSLGGSDISRRLKHAILRWLELGAPDPKFGHLAGYWYEWVPLFESWLDSISAER